MSTLIESKILLYLIVSTIKIQIFNHKIEKKEEKSGKKILQFINEFYLWSFYVKIFFHS